MTSQRRWWVAIYQEGFFQQTNKRYVLRFFFARNTERRTERYPFDCQLAVVKAVTRYAAYPVNDAFTKKLRMVLVCSFGRGHCAAWLVESLRLERLLVGRWAGNNIWIAPPAGGWET